MRRSTFNSKDNRPVRKDKLAVVVVGEALESDDDEEEVTEVSNGQYVHIEVNNSVKKQPDVCQQGKDANYSCHKIPIDNNIGQVNANIYELDSKTNQHDHSILALLTFFIETLNSIIYFRFL